MHEALSYLLVAPLMRVCGLKLLSQLLTSRGLNAQEAIRKTLTTLLGEAPPPLPIDPLSLADHRKLDEALRKGGFSIIDDTSKSIQFDFGPQDDVWRMGLLPGMRP